MDFIQSSNKQVDKHGPGEHGFSPGNPTGGVPATFYSPEWSDGVQQEHINIIKAGGLVPTGASLSQAAQAVKRIAGGYVTTVNAGNSPLALTADHAGLVIMDATAGNIVANLPAANVMAVPCKFRFVRFDATANTATVNRSGADTFSDGTNSFVLSTKGDEKTISSNAAASWFLPKSATLGGYRNLKASATGTNATITITADAVTVESTTGDCITLRVVALAINTATVGANGLSTGVLAGSTRYAKWIAYNPSTGSRIAFIDPSGTAPTVPAGYTHKFRSGWIYTDATGNKYPISFIQSDDLVKYKPAAGSNLTILPAAASGVAGTFGGAPSAVAWAAFAPPTAVALIVQLYTGPGVAAQVTSSTVSGTAGYQGIFTAVPSPGTAAQMVEISLESSNIYYAASGAAATIYISGWRDAL